MILILFITFFSTLVFSNEFEVDVYVFSEKNNQNFKKVVKSFTSPTKINIKTVRPYQNRLPSSVDMETFFEQHKIYSSAFDPLEKDLFFYHVFNSGLEKFKNKYRNIINSKKLEEIWYEYH